MKYFFKNNNLSALIQTRYNCIYFNFTENITKNILCLTYVSVILLFAGLRCLLESAMVKNFFCKALHWNKISEINPEKW